MIYRQEWDGRRAGGVPPFLPINTAYDPRKLENTQIRYGNKRLYRNFVGKIFKNHNIKHYEVRSLMMWYALLQICTSYTCQKLIQCVTSLTLHSFTKTNCRVLMFIFFYKFHSLLQCLLLLVGTPLCHAAVH